MTSMRSTLALLRLLHKVFDDSPQPGIVLRGEEEPWEFVYQIADPPGLPQKHPPHRGGDLGWNLWHPMEVDRRLLTKVQFVKRRFRNSGRALYFVLFDILLKSLFDS